MRKKLFIVNFCVITLLGAINAVNAQTTIIQEISDSYLAKLVETARQHYPQVRSFNSRVKIAEQNVANSKISYLDEFTFSYIYTPHAGQSAGVVATNPVSTTTTGGTSVASNYNYFNSIQVGFFFNPANFLIKPHNVKIAKENLAVAQNDQAEYAITLRSTIKKLYYSYLQRQAELKVQMQTATSDEQTLSILKHRFEGGQETFETYNKAVAAAGANTLLRIATESAYLGAKSDLEAYLGEKIENIK